MNDTNFLLIIFYNPNSESELLCTFSFRQKLLEKVDNYDKDNIVFGGDFNLIFAAKFDVSGGNPILKKRSLVKLIEIKETLYLINICRIRNHKVRRFNVRQNHVSRFHGLTFFCYFVLR